MYLKKSIGPEEEQLTAVNIIRSKRQDMQTLVLQSKAEEDHRGQEIIIHLQFISKVTITTCTYTDIFPPFYVQGYSSPKLHNT